MQADSSGIRTTWRHSKITVCIQLVREAEGRWGEDQGVAPLGASKHATARFDHPAFVPARPQQVLTQFRRHPEMDSAALFTHLCAALQDPAACVRTTALEGMAMLCLSMGASEFLQVNSCSNSMFPIHWQT